MEAHNTIVVFGVPGCGLKELGKVFPGSVWFSEDAVTDLAADTVTNFVIDHPDKLATTEDAALATLSPNDYELVLLMGSELTRLVNRQLLRNWQLPYLELTADLATQARRLGLNRPHTVGLGPVRAMVKTMSAARQSQWADLASPTIDTSHWQTPQFEELAGKLWQGKVSV